MGFFDIFKNPIAKILFPVPAMIAAIVDSQQKKDAAKTTAAPVNPYPTGFSPYTPPPMTIPPSATGYGGDPLTSNTINELLHPPPPPAMPTDEKKE